MLSFDNSRQNFLPLVPFKKQSWCSYLELVEEVAEEE